MESAVDSLNKNADSWAARCFQVSFKKYFEVEQDFVFRKLTFCFFPFYQFGSPSEQQAGQVFDQEAAGSAEACRSVLDCELYIPTMAFISYILLSCLCLGLNAQ